MKKYFAIATSATLAVAAITPAAHAISLKDIKGHPYEQQIKSLINKGVIHGYQDGEFKPEQSLKRWDVVALLGKYLMSIGYKVPTDYKKNMRFSDLTPNSADDLLRYAALVKDNGLFLGDNGRLLHTEFLNRQHAALVLVRAFSVINGIDYAKETEEDLLFFDLVNISEESKAAINVLQFYGIVTDSYFKPNDHATRGQFAYYLHEMMQLQPSNELKIKEVNVLNASRLFVTFTDGTTHNVTLTNELKPNVATKVNFTRLGKRFTTTATYNVGNKLEIASVKNINGSQFTITFNKPIEIETMYLGTDINKIVKLVSRDYLGTPTLLRGDFSEDKRTLLITANPYTVLNKRYYLTISGIRAQDGSKLVKVDESVTFTEDKKAPAILSVENTSTDLVKVKFTEPLSSYNFNSSSAVLASNGKYVSGVRTITSSNPTEVIFDLSNARVDNVALAKYTDVKITFSSLRDASGNYKNNIVTTIRKAEAPADGVAPTVKSITQLGARQFKLTFSEPMSTENMYTLRVTDNPIEKVERDPKDLTSYIVTVEDFLKGFTRIYTREGGYVYDLSGERATIHKTKSFNFDPTSAKIEYTEVVREENNEYLNLYFDKNIFIDNVADVSAQGTYSLDGEIYNLPKALTASVFSNPDNPKGARILLSELLADIDRENAEFTVDLSFQGVENEYEIAMKEQLAVTFNRSKDYTSNANKLKILSVETSRSNSSTQRSDVILINFNHNVDVKTAANIDNYDVVGLTIESVNVNRNNPKQVELTVKAGTISSHTARYLYVEKLRAANSVMVMEPYYEEVYFFENVRPYLTSSAITRSNEVKLTFNEALAIPASDVFIVTNDAGVSLEVETTLAKEDNRQLILTFENTLPRNQRITIRLKSNRQLSDIYYNETTFDILQMMVPYTFPN